MRNKNKGQTLFHLQFQSIFLWHVQMRDIEESNDEFFQYYY
uniref:Uncharacterized protein n=1 Tax=Meloidogyne enterolobii TaxID=390850 RepID=A0A6V7X523_MELEN|nr:unnamed protein product [Meloidogyne enterolobii]